VAKPTEKIIDALTQLMEAFVELRDSIEESEEGEGEEESELEDDEEGGHQSRLVSEFRTALDSVIEAEDFSPDDFASLISSLTEALEEVDPTIFEDEGEEEDEEYEEEDDEDYGEDDEDYDLDEDDLDEDDLDEDEEEEEDEDEDEDD
jgi:hypothetical protein